MRIWEGVHILRQLLSAGMLFAVFLLSTASGQYDFLNEGQDQFVAVTAQSNEHLQWNAYSKAQQKVVSLMALLRRESGLRTDLPLPGYWASPEIPSFAVARISQEGLVTLHLLPRRSSQEELASSTVATIGRGRKATLLGDFDFDGDGR